MPRRASFRNNAVALFALFSSFLSTAVISTAFLSTTAQAAGSSPLPIHDGIGGEFAAESSLGRTVRLSEFEGKAVLLFFGYTSCQDICPATLSHLRLVIQGLGKKADDVQVLLATVDPETDTADRLREYLRRYDDRFIGLTGTREEMDRIASLFKVEHHQSHGVKVSMEHNRQRAFEEQGYLYSHSQQIYLIDKSGRTRAFFFTGSPVEEMREALRSVLAE